MFKFTFIGALLLVAVATIDCSTTVVKSVENNSSSEYSLGLIQFDSEREYEVSVVNFQIENGKENSTIGFAMMKTTFLSEDNFDGYCLKEKFFEDTDKVVAFFIMDFVNEQVQVKMSKSWTNFMIFEDRETAKAFNGTKTTVDPLKLVKDLDQSNEKYSYYSFMYYIVNDSEDNDGIYDYHLHNCDQINHSFSFRFTYDFNNTESETITYVRKNDTSEYSLGFIDFPSHREYEISVIDFQFENDKENSTYYIVNDSENDAGLFEYHLHNCDQVEHSFQLKYTTDFTNTVSEPTKDSVTV
ncbi:unnamed protein product [Diamesa serratosioi]